MLQVRERGQPAEKALKILFYYPAIKERMTKLIPAKCPSCGANLEFPDNMDVGHCMHCGGKVIIDKEVHIHGQVAIACPECGGKGHHPCKSEDLIDEGETDYLTIKKQHNSKMVMLIMAQRFHRGKYWARAMGCEGTGICHSATVKVANKNFEFPRISRGSKNDCNAGTCADCRGTGKLSLDSAHQVCNGTGKCLICQGTGKCTICGGTGKHKCTACDGTGFKIYKG